MSARFYGGRVTITGTATSLASLLATAEPTIKNLGLGAGTIVTCRAETTNAAVIYFGYEDNTAPGTSTVTAAGAHSVAYIGAGEARAFGASNLWNYLSGIYAIGTANDLMYLDIVEA